MAAPALSHSSAQPILICPTAIPDGAHAILEIIQQEISNAAQLYQQQRAEQEQQFLLYSARAEVRLNEAERLRCEAQDAAQALQRDALRAREERSAASRDAEQARQELENRTRSADERGQALAHVQQSISIFVLSVSAQLESGSSHSGNDLNDPAIYTSTPPFSQLNGGLSGAALDRLALRLRERLGYDERRCEDLQKKYDILKREKNELEATHTLSQSSALEQKNAADQLLKDAEHARLEMETEKSSEMAALKARLVVSEENLYRAQVMATAAAEASAQSAEKGKIEVDTLRGRVAEMETAIREAAARDAAMLSSMKSQIASLTVTIAELHRQLRAAEGSRAAAEDLHAKVHALEGELQAAQMRLEADRAASDQEKAAKDTAIGELNARNTVLENAHNAERDNMESNAELVDGLLARITDLEDQLAAVTPPAAIAAGSLQGTSPNSAISLGHVVGSGGEASHILPVVQPGASTSASKNTFHPVPSVVQPGVATSASKNTFHLVPSVVQPGVSTSASKNTFHPVPPSSVSAPGLQSGEKPRPLPRPQPPKPSTSSTPLGSKAVLKATKDGQTSGSVLTTSTPRSRSNILSSGPNLPSGSRGASSSSLPAKQPGASNSTLANAHPPVSHSSNPTPGAQSETRPRPKPRPRPKDPAALLASKIALEAMKEANAPVSQTGANAVQNEPPTSTLTKRKSIAVPPASSSAAPSSSTASQSRKGKERAVDGGERPPKRQRNNEGQSNAQGAPAATQPTSTSMAPKKTHPESAGLPPSVQPPVDDLPLSNVHVGSSLAHDQPVTTPTTDEASIYIRLNSLDDIEDIFHQQIQVSRATTMEDLKNAISALFDVPLPYLHLIISGQPDFKPEETVGMLGIQDGGEIAFYRLEPSSP